MRKPAGPAETCVSGFPRTSLTWPISARCRHTVSGWHSCLSSAFNTDCLLFGQAPDEGDSLCLGLHCTRNVYFRHPEAHYVRDRWGPRLAGGATGASLLLQNWPRFAEQMQLTACTVTVPRPSLHATLHRSVTRECRHITGPSVWGIRMFHKASGC